MNNILKAIMITVLVAGIAIGNDEVVESKYQIGGRSANIIGTLELSMIDPAFDDLEPDGIKGPHHSGLFFRYKIKPWLSLGIETLVGNSDIDAETTMDFQAVGPVVNLEYGKKFFVTGGLHFGAVIADAMHRDDDITNSGIQTGTHFKSAGLFTAPYVGIGVRIKKYDFSLFLKNMEVYYPEDNEANRIKHFSAAYYGISTAINL